VVAVGTGIQLPFVVNEVNSVFVPPAFGPDNIIRHPDNVIHRQDNAIHHPVVLAPMPSVTRPMRVNASVRVDVSPPTTEWGVHRLRISSELPADWFGKFSTMLDDFSSAFAESSDHYGCARVEPLEFDVFAEFPIHRRPFRLARDEAAWCQTMAETLERHDRISKSDSAWCAPAFPVPKPNGTDTPDWRFVTDFGHLKLLIPPDCFPTPLAQDIFDKLSGAKFFSKVDFQHAYLQIPVHERCRKYLSFSVGGEQYEYNYVPFGLNIAGGKLQRELQRLFRGIVGVFGYADDWIIASATLAEHLVAVAEVVRKARDVGFVIKPSKCLFAVSRMEFLGRVVDSEGVHLHPDDITMVQEWPVPHSDKDLQRFFGMGEWCSEFVPDYATHVRALREAVRSDGAFVWTAKAAGAFAEVKKCFLEALTLSFPDFGIMFRLDVDASVGGFGAVLRQGSRVIRVAHRRTTAAESALPPTFLELAAASWACQHFRSYLHGAKFELGTDHKAITWLRGLARPPGKLALWALEFSEFDFDVVFVPGKQHVAADAISRRDNVASVSILAVGGGGAVSMDGKLRKSGGQDNIIHHQDNIIHHSVRGSGHDAVFVGPIEQVPVGESVPSVADFRREQQADSFCSDLIKRFIAGEEWVSETYVLDPNNVLCHARRHFGLPYFRVVVPVSLRLRVLAAAHRQAGHLKKATIALVNRSFYWVGMPADTLAFVDSCLRCQSLTSPRGPRGVPVGALTALSPGELVCVDLMELPLSSDGLQRCYAMVCSDVFSRFVVAAAIENKEAATVAAAFKRVWLDDASLSKPRNVLSDQGPEFMGAFKTLLRSMGIRKMNTTPYHPQGDGIVERLNQTLQHSLAALTVDRLNWPQYLSAAVAAYNETESAATGFPPVVLMKGRAPAAATDGELVDARVVPSVVLQEVKAAVLKINSDKRARMTRLTTKHKHLRFKLNERVEVRDLRVRQAAMSKLTPEWVICRVIKKKTPFSYTVKAVQPDRYGYLLCETVHVKNIKRFRSPIGYRDTTDPPLAAVVAEPVGSVLEQPTFFLPYVDVPITVLQPLVLPQALPLLPLAEVPGAVSSAVMIPLPPHVDLQPVAQELAVEPDLGLPVQEVLQEVLQQVLPHVDTPRPERRVSDRKSKGVSADRYGFS